MPTILVKKLPGDNPQRFQVRVEEDNGTSQHEVSLSTTTWHRLGGTDAAPERCIEAAFRFLLDRETKESILGQFDIDMISGYFPEFERIYPDYLRGGN